MRLPLHNAVRVNNITKANLQKCIEYRGLIDRFISMDFSYDISDITPRPRDTYTHCMQKRQEDGL